MVFMPKIIYLDLIMHLPNGKRVLKYPQGREFWLKNQEMFGPRVTSYGIPERQCTLIIPFKGSHKRRPKK
jgi:hypothetical protein